MSKQTIELALGLNRLADPDAWGSPEAFEAFKADARARAALLREGLDAADTAATPDTGALDGTARILLAAVQRLAEENGRLAAEVAALRGATGGPDAGHYGGGEALRAEGLEAVEVHRAEVVFAEAADERQTAAGDAFTATDETLPDDWTDQGEPVGGFVAGDAADEFSFPNATW